MTVKVLSDEEVWLRGFEAIIGTASGTTQVGGDLASRILSPYGLAKGIQSADDFLAEFKARFRQDDQDGDA